MGKIKELAIDTEDFRGGDEEYDYIIQQKKLDDMFRAILDKEPDAWRKRDMIADIRMQEAFEAGRKEMRHKVARYAEPLHDNPTAMDFLGQ